MPKKLYRLLLLLQVLIQCEGLCVGHLKPSSFGNAYTGYCSMIWNPSQFSLLPKYINNSSVLYIKMTISSSSILKMQRDTFIDTANVVTLSIEHSNVSEIGKGAFDNFIGMQILKLPHNNITILKANTFSSGLPLERLEIPNNELNTLETGVFAKLMKLKVLDLAYNNISKINKAFYSLKQLLALNVSHNSLTSLESGSFAKMFLLEKLNLSNNKILAVEEEAFVDLKQLSLLDLSNNLIKSIHPQAFERIGSIENIYLNNNNIAELLALRDLEWLRILNLENNSLVKIEWLDFQKPKLIELSLRGNRIRAVEPGSFAHLEILMKLDLSKNLLTSLNTETFYGLKALEYLNISQNRIETISGFPFKYLSAIQNLDLSNNELNSFDPSDLLYLDMFLDLRGNPFSCSTLSDLVRKLKDSNVTLVDGNVCNGDENIITEHPLETYPEHDFKHPNFADRLQIVSENKLTEILRNFTITTLANNYEIKSMLTLISKKLEKLVVKKHTNRKIKRNRLKELIDVYNSGDKSRNENFKELLMIMRKMSIPEKKYDFYIVAATNFTIIIMLGVLIAVIIYFKRRNSGRRTVQENANEMTPL